MTLLFQQLQQQVKMMEQQFGGPIEGLEILEIGPGPGMERARYLGLRNSVVGLDMDVIPQGNDLRAYLAVLRQNGLGRLIKTIGRRITIAGPNRRAWNRVVGRDDMPDPGLLVGDICAAAPMQASYDLVMSWSVFEHLPDPQAALKNIIDALRPGGIFFISIHLYTANNGHHDIRAFSGHEQALPAWAHLRPTTRAVVRPSAFLNQWRLADWRKLFLEAAPGYDECLVTHNRQYAHLLTADVRQELREYSEEELIAVDVIYRWQKPVAD